MPETFSILSEIAGAVIGAVTGIPIEQGSGLIGRSIGREILVKKIRKREAFLKSKYQNRLEPLSKMDKDSFYEWLKEERTIHRILSFCNAEDTGNLSAEQMRHLKEHFFADAFCMAEVHDLREKEELRKLLNDLFQYVDELFWKSLDEKDVFLYKKCVAEIRQFIRESTETVIQEIRYHGSFAEYIDSQKAIQKVPFKLDYRSEEIPFVGREKEFEKIDAFCAFEEQISWWAVIGKGGSGKSRLVYEYIKDKEKSPDWKMCFLHEEFFHQAGGGGKYKNWNTWTYDKNLLLVIDYVQKYAKETAQWIEELSRNNSITRKIRILLLERTGGEESLWYREGFDKEPLVSLQYPEDILQLQSLENDLPGFAGQYAQKNHQVIRTEEAEDALRKLKSIDPDARILYFIMILEAIFHKEPWRNWSQTDLVDYIVKREQKDIAVRLKGDKKMIRSFNRLLAFGTATEGLPVFELPPDLPEQIKEEIKEIRDHVCDKQELCAVMQLEDNILQPITPDIIGEYMVLYIIDQYFLEKKEQIRFVKDLWTYDSGDFLFFIFHLVQDKMYDGAYSNIINLMLFDAVPKGNIHVIEDYSVLMWGLTAISDLKQTLTYIEILEKIYHDYPSDKKIACSYADGLVNLSFKQEQPELKETITKLEQHAVENADNAEIQTAYAKGLVNLSCEQELLELKETIAKLEKHAEENADNAEIQTAYANGLVNLSCKQEQPELKETITKLEQHAVENADNAEIQTAYAGGLSNLSRKQALPELKETIAKLEKYAVENADNAEIQTAYAKGLVSLSCEQELPERKETITKLEQHAVENADNVEIQVAYAYGLFNLSNKQELPELKETITKLEQHAMENVDNAEIQTTYAKGLFNLSNKQEQPERKETIVKLEKHAGENTDNAEIQTAYAKGLFNLSCEQEQPERKETIAKLEKHAVEHAGNVEIQVEYAWGLFNLSCEQEQPEGKETIAKLEKHAMEHAGNVEIQVEYAWGLFNLSCEQEQSERKETIARLEQHAMENADNAEIQIAYAKGLLILSNKQELPERKETILRLKRLAKEHADNPELQAVYAKGLAILNKHYPDEK